jgi:hypothetical protein
MRCDPDALTAGLQLHAAGACRRGARLAAAALVLAACLPGTVAAQDGDATRDFLKCMELGDPQARLACYDRLAVAVVELGLAASRKGSAAVDGATGAATGAAAAATDAAAGSAAAVQPTPAANPEQDFGMARRADESVDSISAGVVGGFQGWSGSTRFELDNGQVWIQADSGRFDYSGEDRRVAIRRAAFGSFMLSPEGLNRSVRVRRVE